MQQTGVVLVHRQPSAADAEAARGGGVHMQGGRGVLPPDGGVGAECAVGLWGQCEVGRSVCVGAPFVGSNWSFSMTKRTLRLVNKMGTCPGTYLTIAPLVWEGVC